MPGVAASLMAAARPRAERLVRHKRMEYRALFHAAYDLADEALTDADGNELATRRVAAQALSDRAIAIVTLGLTAVVGVLAFAEVSDSIPLDVSGSDPDNASQLENAGANFTTDFGSAIELFGPVMIVVVAALILRVVRGF